MLVDSRGKYSSFEQQKSTIYLGHRKGSGMAKNPTAGAGGVVFCEYRFSENRLRKIDQVLGACEHLELHLTAGRPLLCIFAIIRCFFFFFHL